MPRRRRPTTGMESYAELDRKLEILERELEAQRIAIEKLKELGKPVKTAAPATPPTVRKSA